MLNDIFYYTSLYLLSLFSFSAVATKVDVLVSQSGAAHLAQVGQRGPQYPDSASTGSINQNLVNEITHIKNTESNILHQLADLRSELDI